VTKPFSLAELGARVRAVLGRTQANASDEASIRRAGPLSVDIRKREVRLEGQPIEVTPTEFRLLACLSARVGEAVSQEALVDQVWGEERQGGASGLRRYVWFLRQKIEIDPDHPQRLVTVRGFGYRLEA
jgi:two-component system KDP operon response regulator KdpE